MTLIQLQKASMSTSRQKADIVPLYATYAPPPLIFEKGNNIYLYTKEGASYLDCISGIAVSALGHSHPKLVKALKDQAEKLWHLSNMFMIESQIELAQKYCEHSIADKVFFTNSGTEAIECALKTARHYHFSQGNGHRYKIITFKGAFHGRTYGAINAGGNPKYMEGFGPVLPGYEHIDLHDVSAVKHAVDSNTAAILIEPIQGEGGVRPVEINFLKSLREICDQEGILLIYDEIQSGSGRTGKLFAYQWADQAEPDIIAMAKGMGGGFPLGACLATDQAASSMIIGTHGSTYGGNPLATSVGCVVLNELLKEGFLDHVIKMGNLFKKELQKLADQYNSMIELVRGKGLLLGIKMKPHISNEKIIEIARNNHLLVGKAGDNIVRFAPPLIITESQIHEVSEKLNQTFKQVENSL